ncbi:MAG TPA: hypothetical protein VMV69_09335 [Pirellulales bacterium]|nr:hypothetical protein [Pirellulales bacterium]
MEREIKSIWHGIRPTDEVGFMAKSGWALFRPALGLALIATGALKAEAFLDPGQPAGGPSLSPLLLFVAVEVEFILGVWLISGLAPRLSWVAVLSCFAMFACTALYLLLTGAPGCGCLGRLPARPSVLLGFDIGTLAVLAVLRPQRANRVSRTPACDERSKAPWSALFGIAGAVLFVVAIAFSVFGSPQALGVWLRGERVVISPRFVRLGHGKAGERKRVDFEIRNMTDRTVTVFGATWDCSCNATEGLPAHVPAGGAVTLHALVKFAEARGQFSQRVCFYTDSPEQWSVVAVVQGHVTDDRSSNTATSG